MSVGFGFHFDEEKIQTTKKRCSECGKVLVFGDTALVSRNRRGEIMKRVCSEDCRLEFDHRFWYSEARNKRGEFRMIKEIIKEQKLKAKLAKVVA